jgi:enolase
MTAGFLKCLLTYTGLSQLQTILTGMQSKSERVLMTNKAKVIKDDNDLWLIIDSDEGGVAFPIKEDEIDLIIEALKEYKKAQS